MNDTIETTVEFVAEDGTVTLVPATITSGSDSDGEAAQQETTVFVAEDSESVSIPA